MRVSRKSRYGFAQPKCFPIYRRVDQWPRLLYIDGGICSNRAGGVEVVTRYKRMLQSCDVGPTVDKITMESITSSIAIGKDQVFEIQIWRGVEEEFVKDRDESHRVRFRANSPVEGTNSGICNVVLVIGGIEVDPIPARWKINLGTKGYAGFWGEANILSRAAGRFTHDCYSQLSLIGRVKGSVEEISESLFKRQVRLLFTNRLLVFPASILKPFGNARATSDLLQYFVAVV